MDKESDKKLDDLMVKVFSDAPLESPSLDFTSKIMGQIENLPNTSALTYRPLIPKFVWVCIMLFIGAIFGLVIFVGVHMEYPWAISLNFDRIPNFQWSEGLSHIRVSDTLVFGVMGFTFFTYLQIIFLKRHFDKRFMVH